MCGPPRGSLMANHGIDSKQRLGRPGKNDPSSVIGLFKVPSTNYVALVVGCCLILLAERTPVSPLHAAIIMDLSEESSRTHYSGKQSS